MDKWCTEGGMHKPCLNCILNHNFLESPQTTVENWIVPTIAINIELQIICNKKIEKCG